MCGTPYTVVPAGAVAATALQQSAMQQLPSYQPQAYPTEPAHRPTHAQPPESDFESLFRPADGQVSAYSHTQLIPPVEADYRMPPPSGTQSVGPYAFDGAGAEPTQLVHPQSGDLYPPGPGSDEVPEWDDEEPRGVRKPVVWATLAAVVAASAVILGLLYIGSHNNNAAGAGNGAPTNAPTTAAPATPTVGSVNLAPGSASPSPSASPSASPSPSVTQGGTTLPLSLGSTGQYVHYVQTRLHQLGYYQGDINSQYDQATAQAVLNFQAKAGVTGDPAATVGQSTLTALLAAGSKPDLRLGQRSGDVKRLQESLNAAENAGLTISGKFDAETFAAVRHYQQQVGVEQTGSMNGQTWTALQSGHVA
jgi:peptidoglycan hydrolase-like protein with peptidoglycan-binding domain